MTNQAKLTAFYPQIGTIEVAYKDVFDLEDKKIGVVLVPVHYWNLDLIDDPLTLFASDNGLDVDDLYCDYD